MTSPRDIATEAAAWIARRDAGFSAPEAAEFAAWCAADPRHAEALAGHEAVWSALDRPRTAGASAAVHEQLCALRRRQRWRRAVAVGALAGCAALAFFLRPGKAAREIAPTAKATAVLRLPEHVALPDGSAIEHPPGAVFEINFTATLRQVTLRSGTAHFTVAKDPKRPFVVAARGVEVRAVGTVFAVELGDSGVGVLVTEGRVAVGSPAAPAAGPAMVDAGQSLAVAPDATAVTVPPAEINARLAWRSPRLEFSATPLGEVVALMNRHHRVRFVIEDPVLARVPLSGVFRADDTEAFVHMMERGFGIASEHVDAATIRLRRAP